MSMPAGMKGFAAQRKEIVEDNVTNRGSRLLSHLTIAILTSVILSGACLQSIEPTEDVCTTSPVKLKSWFAGMSVMQGMSCIIFCLMQCSLTPLLSKLAQQRPSRTEEPSQPRPQQPEQPPAPPADPPQPAPSPEPNPAPSPAPVPPQPPAPEPAAVSGLDWCLLVNLMLSTNVILCLTGLIITWSVLGIVSAINAVQIEGCETGRMLIWFLAVVTFCQTCFCHVCSLCDTHTDRRSDQAPISGLARIV